MSRNLSDRFTLKKVGDLQDICILEHGRVEWVSFPKSHLADLHKIVQRELILQRELSDEDDEA